MAPRPLPEVPEIPGGHQLSRRPDRGFWALGHRGARDYAQGNSLEAFDLALEMGADGVELDVRRTRDGSWITYHDKTYVAGKRRLPVAELEGDAVPQGSQRIGAVVDWVQAHPEALVNIEIKDAVHSEELADWFRDLADRVFFTSHIPDAVWALRQAHPAYLTGLLTAHRGRFSLQVARLAGCSLVVRRDGDVDAEVVAATRQAGLATVVWDVYSRRRMRALAEMGVLAVITDRFPVEAGLGRKD